MANTTYVVKKGDTLSKIASENNTTVDNLMSLNKLTDPNYIVVGQTLIISGSAKKIKKNNKKHVCSLYDKFKQNKKPAFAGFFLR